MIDHNFLTEIVLTFGSVTAVATVCHAIRLPTIVGFILAGVLIGPSGLGLVKSLPNAYSLAEVATIFLMFTIGLEFSIARLVKLRRAFVGLGMAQVLLTVIATAGVMMYWRGISVLNGVFWGFLVALSSTALVLKLMDDARDIETPHGTHTLTILLLQDIAFIPMMLLLPVLAGRPLSSVGALATSTAGNWLQTGGVVIIVPVAIYVMAKWIVPKIMDHVVATRSREVFYFSVLFFCLGTAWLFHNVGLSLSLGAFAAGIVISEGPYSRQVASDALPLRDSFMGLFFASIGMMVDISFVIQHAAVILIIGIGVVIVKAASIMAVGFLNNLAPSVAIIMGLNLAQIGEFSFILGGRGLDLGLMTQSQYQWFLSVAIVTMTVTPFIYKFAPKIAVKSGWIPWKVSATTEAGGVIRKAVSVSNSHTTHPEAFIIGFGLTGQHVAEAFDGLGVPWCVMDMNHHSIKKLKARGKRAVYGDATRVDVLAHAGLDRARLVIVAVTGGDIVPAILSAVRAIRPDVQIIVRTQFVRDLEKIARDPHMEVVVGEIETGIEILARTLREFGVTESEIHRYLEQSRTAITAHAQIGSSLRGPTLQLAGWDALSSIRPMRIMSEFKAVGKSLAELELPRRCRASIVSVFRDGLGTKIPDGSFKLEAGDVLHVIGAPEALKEAEHLLTTGV